MLGAAAHLQLKGTLRLSALRRKLTGKPKWAAIENGSPTAGVSGFAREALGGGVFCSLPESGTESNRPEESAVLEV